MLRRVKMLGRVFVFGRIATAHVTAGAAETQVYPLIAHFEALLTSVGLGFDVVNLIQMIACGWQAGSPFNESAALRFA
jgi:hypothetical protein